MSLIHQNLQSIGNCVNLIDDLLEDQRNCVAFCATEHWKTVQQMSNIGIKGFQLASSFCRVEENRHGGSAIYIKKGLNYRVRSDINKLGLEDHFEFVVVR